VSLSSFSSGIPGIPELKIISTKGEIWSRLLSSAWEASQHGDIDDKGENAFEKKHGEDSPCESSSLVSTDMLAAATLRLYESLFPSLDLHTRGPYVFPSCFMTPYGPCKIPNRIRVPKTGVGRHRLGAMFEVRVRVREDGID